ncbi:unnamed protein product [Prunus armeniaca]
MSWAFPRTETNWKVLKVIYGGYLVGDMFSDQVNPGKMLGGLIVYLGYLSFRSLCSGSIVCCLGCMEVIVKKRRVVQESGNVHWRRMEQHKCPGVGCAAYSDV